MPKVSDRQRTLKQLDKLIKMMAMCGEDGTPEFDELLDLKVQLLSLRYMNLKQHVAKNKSMNEMLWSYQDREFKQIVRMKKDSFVQLVVILQENPIFGSDTQRHRQTPVWTQVMIVLQRLGNDGSGICVGRCAINGGYSVGSICKFTVRVIKAITDLRKEVIKWPDAAERARISAFFGHTFGLPGAVGVVDGTPIIFAQQPGIDGETWWTRKCHYAMNLQLVCDHRKRIIYFIVGWPGSVFDNTVMEKTDLFRDPTRFLALGQFLLADSGYAAKWFVCTLYKKPLSEEAHNGLFNELFSRARVLIEHVNGILKARWQCL